MLEVGREVARPLEEALVGGQLRQARGRDLADDAHRVLRPGPELGVDGGEEIPRRGVPGPPEIAGQLLEHGQGLGEDGADGEPADGFHEPEPRACMNTFA